MSHATGWVVIDSKTVGYFDYCGSTDKANSRIYDTPKDLQEHWLSWEENECECECEYKKNLRFALLYTNYGDGYHWPGMVCLKCKAIIQGTNPWGEDCSLDPIDGPPPGSDVPAQTW